MTLDMIKINCNDVLDFHEFLVHGLFLFHFQPLILIWPSISKYHIFFKKNHESNSEALIFIN